MDVPAAVAAMAAAVKAGDFAAADRLGREASCPLSIPKHALRLSAPISEGAQATVLAALYVPPAEDGGAGTGPPVPVAVKRPRIRESADLERFREEVALLAQLQHPGLVRLIGARLLPPGERFWDSLTPVGAVRAGQAACLLDELQRTLQPAPCWAAKAWLVLSPLTSACVQITARCWSWRQQMRQQSCTARGGAPVGRPRRRWGRRWRQCSLTCTRQAWCTGERFFPVLTVKNHCIKDLEDWLPQPRCGGVSASP